MKTNKFQIFLTKYVNKFIVIALPALLFADDRLRLIHADILENRPVEGGSVQELKGDVLFKKGEMELSCKKAIFNERTGMATLTGSTNVVKNDLHLTCDSLLFYSQEDILKNFNNVHIWDNDYNLTADSVIYLTEIDSGYANGNAKLIQQKQTINADALHYHKKPESDAVSYEALGNVIIEEGTRIATCGHAIYNRDLGETVLKINPEIDDGGRNLSGTEISLYYENEQLKTILIPEKAHMVSPQFGWRKTVGDSLTQRDSVKTMNDLKGKTLNGFFIDGELNSLRLAGMAMSVYHVFEDSIYKGINEASGDTITMLFDKEDMEEILISGGGQGTFIPDSTNANTESSIIYSSNNIQYLTGEELTHLKKNASITHESTKLTAGYMKLNMKSNVLNALPTFPDDTTDIPIKPTVEEKGKEPMRGDEILYNLKSKKGRITMGDTKMDDGYYYGEEIRNQEEGTYYIRESIYTTCDLVIPHFHFASDKMKMINQDKVVARPLILYVGGIPIFGIPFAIFPHQHGGRHSGWIMPTYGESTTRGQFLDGLGYYWAPNPYWDSKALLSFADRQGLTFKLYNRYNRRYSYRGNLKLETLYFLSSQKDITQISDDNRTSFVLDWRHSQTLRNDQRLNVNAKYYSNGEYNRNTGLDPTIRLKQQAVSNATYSKQWKKWKNSLSMNLSSTRDLMADEKIDSSSVFYQEPYKAGQKLNITNNTLPSLSFRHGQSQLFLEKSTLKRWYNNISWNYSSSFNNKMQTYFESDKDTTWIMDGNEGYVKSESDPVATHNFGLSAPQKIFKYISVNPSLSLKQVWVDKTFNATLDTETNSLVTIEKPGFETRTTGSFRVSFRTQFYGMFPIKLGVLRGVRHVASPSVGYSYTPDFSEPLFGYDFGYFETFKDSDGNPILDEHGNPHIHDRFKGTRAGSSPKSKSQSMSLSLNNVFQAKVGEDEEEKKIDLFSWNMSTNYNFVADSMNLANLRSSVRTKLGKKLNLDLSMTHDFYQLRWQDGERINEFNKLPRLINARISTAFRFSGNYLNSEKQRDEETETDTLDMDELDLGLFQDKKESAFISNNTGELWSTSLNLSYSLNKSNPEKEKETFWINTNTDIQVTPNWKVKYSARFDVLERELVSQSFSIYRDLHCWELSLNWTPSGFGQGVYLKINVKSPTLRDIKIEQKSGLYGRRAF